MIKSPKVWTKVFLYKYQNTAIFWDLAFFLKLWNQKIIPYIRYFFLKFPFYWKKCMYICMEVPNTSIWSFCVHFGSWKYGQKTEIFRNDQQNFLRPLDLKPTVLFWSDRPKFTICRIQRVYGTFPNTNQIAPEIAIVYVLHGYL